MKRNSTNLAVSAIGRRPSRRTLSFRRFGTAVAGCTAAGVMAVGLMFVAVPAASAKTAAMPPFETIVTAAPAVLQSSPPALNLFTLTATLDWVQPIAGEPIVFTAGGTTLCTATTNYLGVASCNVLGNVTGLLAVLATGGYTASFAGDNSFSPGFAPSSGSAALIG